MPRIDFIDISHHNTVQDFSQVKAAGVVGVIAKATEGTTFIDPDYAAYRAAARSSGLKWASYHFLKHGSVEAQMSHYLNVVDPAPGERLVIDYEDVACTADDLRQAVEALQQAGRFEITVYGASKLTDDVNRAPTGTKTLLAKTSLWAARYSAKEPVISPVWPYFSAWQYSDKGSVPGISGACDVNLFNGSPEACAAWFGPAAVTPTPPVVEDRSVIINIEADEGVAVGVTVNGEVIA